jgi:hypothetical protein
VSLLQEQTPRKKYHHYRQSEKNQRARNNVNDNFLQDVGSYKSHFLEDSILYSHRRENLKSYTTANVVIEGYWRDG